MLSDCKLMKIAVFLLALVLSFSSAATATPVTEAQGLKDTIADTAAHSCAVLLDLLHFSCIIPQSFLLSPWLCSPLFCCLPIVPLFYLLTLPLNLCGYVFMLFLGALYTITGRSMEGIALIPTVCSTLSYVISSLLTYPAMQASCLSCCSCLPCLPCAILTSPLTLLCAIPMALLTFFRTCCDIPCILAALILSIPVPFYYREIFPRLTGMRQRASEDHKWLNSPFFGLISYNFEHTPSCIEIPALWWQCLLFLHPEQCISLPICCFTFIPCLPITLISFLFNFCLQLPSIIHTVRKLQQNALINPQDSCLPTYPGIIN